MTKPLSHVRVLDLSRLLPGPMATLHLADLGADVVRIDDVGQAPAVPRELYTMLNRNKRAMRIDLRQAAGREIFLRLAGAADVIVESFRPGVVDRLGVGYEAVRPIHPRIVYCAISGYGQTGSDRLRSGHDINYLAAAGVGDQIGVAGGPPALPNFQIGDLLGGTLTAVMGILAALVDARTSGNGRYIDVSMTGSLLAHAVVARAGMAAAGRAASRGEDMLSGALPCYNYYRTQDGRYLAVGALEPKFWERLCDAIGRPDLKAGQFAMGEEARRVREELQEIFGAHDSAHWTGVFREVDCCVSLVLTLDEAVRERRPEGLPLKMSGCEFAAGCPAAPPGAHTEEILAAAGYTPEEIARLRAARVI